MLQDKLLIWKFKRGSLDALRQIYDRYKGDLLKLAIVVTGDISGSEDVVQDVFVKLAESSDKIGIHGNLKNYLITCLMNRIRTLRRDGRRHREAQLDQADIGSSRVHRPDEWAVLNEQMQRLRDAMMHLPLEQRQVVALRFDAGLGFRQIARIQDASINTVQGRYRYAIEKLRSVLDGELTE